MNEQVAVRYARTPRVMWDVTRDWNDCEKLLAFYLPTNRHCNMLGCYTLPKGYIAEDLNWSPEQLEKPFAKLLEVCYIQYDEASRLLLIPDYLEHDPICNENQAKAAAKLVRELPKSPLLSELKQLVERLDKPFMKPLLEQLAERLGKPVTVTVSDSVTVPVTVSEEKPADGGQVQEPGAGGWGSVVDEANKKEPRPYGKR